LEDLDVGKTISETEQAVIACLELDDDDEKQKQ
jgi:hypothetical protein